VVVRTGQLAVRSATRRTAALSPMQRTAVAIRLGGPAIRMIAATRPTAAWERTRLFVYKAVGKAVRLTSSFPLALAREVGSSIWLVLKTIHWQGCHGDGRTDTSVRPSVTSDKARVRHIRVNGMLTSKRVKPELLCPRWLPHHCHVGSLAITL
jgi:hypothetical protein